MAKKTIKAKEAKGEIPVEVPKEIPAESVAPAQIITEQDRMSYGNRP